MDLLILEELNDKDLFNFCLTDKYANSLCKVESFWMNRFRKRFSKVAPKYGEYKPKSWRNRYLKVVFDLDKYSKDPWSFLSKISWNLHNDNIDNLTNDKEEYITNNFWLLNLGTEVNINYLLDPYGIAPYISRNYKASTFSIPYFTPNFILHLVHNFYQEPMTKEELQLQQEENPLAGDYSLEDADEGKVLRIDMFENPIFQGFSHLMDNNRYILL